jgi:PAS domain S-box-containing protein
VTSNQKAELIFAEQSEDMIRHHPLAMLVVNPDDGQILHANSAAVHFYGWSVEKLLAMKMIQLDLLSEKSLREIMALVQDQQPRSFQSQHRMADGQIRTVEVHIVPAPWNQRPAMYSIIVDITGQKKTEAALRASEDRFRQFAQHLPVPLVYGNQSSGRNEFVNTQFVQTFGYALEDVPTMSKWWNLAYPDKKYRRVRMGIWKKAMVAGKECPIRIEPREAKITCKSGEMRLFIVSGAIMDEGFLATFIDITEQRQDERLLMASYERKRKNDLLNDLIQHDAPSGKVLSACERTLGNRVKGSFNCYLLVMNTYKGKARKYWLDRRDVYQPLLDSIVDALENERTIAWESTDGLGILRFGDELANPRKIDQVKQAEEILQTVERYEPEFDGAIGIAERAGSLSEIGSYYRQAVVSAHSGRKIWPQRKIFHYHDIGILQLYPYLNDKKQVNNYIERTLGPVLQYDEHRKVKLLPTLECILLSDNLKSAAGRLSIHYKTLLFRKRHLEQILTVDLDDLDVRISVGSAIKMMKLGAEKEA